MAGFESAKRFAKVGKHASDTCLLTLENVVVPAENLIGRKEKDSFICEWETTRSAVKVGWRLLLAFPAALEFRRREG